MGKKVIRDNWGHRCTRSIHWKQGFRAWKRSEAGGIELAVLSSWGKEAMNKNGIPYESVGLGEKSKNRAWEPTVPSRESSREEGGLRMHTHVQTQGLVLVSNTHMHAHVLTRIVHTQQHGYICIYMNMYKYTCMHTHMYLYKCSLTHSTRSNQMWTGARISHRVVRGDLQVK